MCLSTKGCLFLTIIFKELVKPLGFWSLRDTCYADRKTALPCLLWFCLCFPMLPLAPFHRNEAYTAPWILTFLLKHVLKIIP